MQLPPPRPVLRMPKTKGWCCVLSDECLPRRYPDHPRCARSAAPGVAPQPVSVIVAPSNNSTVSGMRQCRSSVSRHSCRVAHQNGVQARSDRRGGARFAASLARFRSAHAQVHHARRVTSISPVGGNGPKRLGLAPAGRGYRPSARTPRGIRAQGRRPATKGAVAPFPE